MDATSFSRRQVSLARELHRRERRGRLRRRQRRRVEVGTRGFGQVRDQVGIADHRGAVTAERLAERDQLQAGRLRHARLAAATQPRPSGPSTPTPCASST
jgi:hypothetical protein